MHAHHMHCVHTLVYTLRCIYTYTHLLARTTVLPPLLICSRHSSPPLLFPRLGWLLSPLSHPCAFSRRRRKLPSFFLSSISPLQSRLRDSSPTRPRASSLHVHTTARFLFLSALHSRYFLRVSPPPGPLSFIKHCACAKYICSLPELSPDSQLLFSPKRLIILACCWRFCPLHSRFHFSVFGP